METKDKLVTAESLRLVHNTIQKGVSDIEKTVSDVKKDVSEHDRKLDEFRKLSNLIGLWHGKWSAVERVIAGGSAPECYPVGECVDIPWCRIASSGSATMYTPTHNVVHHGEVIYSLNGGTTEIGTKGMYLEWDMTIPDAIAFCPAQALQCFDGTGGAPDGLPAGKYAVFCTDCSWSKAAPVYKKKYLVFTLTKPIPSGGVILGSGISDSASGWKFVTYNTHLNTKTAIETAAITPSETLPNDATYLGGTWGDETEYGKLNHIECVAYGDNTWEASDLRQWLNSDSANWWSKKGRYNIQPSVATTMQGFLCGYPKEFKSHLKPIKLQTFSNTVKGNFGIVTTYDKVFLRSNSQANITTEDVLQYEAPYTEGEPWEYYQKMADGQSGLDEHGRFKMFSTYPVLISHSINAPTVATAVFGRSARRSFAYLVLYVNTSGSCTSASASYGSRCRPACVICGASPDATQSGGR